MVRCQHSAPARRRGTRMRVASAVQIVRPCFSRQFLQLQRVGCLCNLTEGEITTSWVITGAQTLSETSTCLTLLGFYTKAYYKANYTCGHDKISSVGVFCIDAGCNACNNDPAYATSAADAYTTLINHTWSTQSYLAMHYGDCVNATVAQYLDEGKDIDGNPKYSNTTAISMIQSGTRLTLYPCSYLSTAPTPAPTAAAG